MVNENTASAAEILSGSLQDYGFATLVGTTTYGKGSVQTVHNLQTGAGVRITEGKYFLPGGTCIDGVGIEPDIYVEEYEGDIPETDDPLEELKYLDAQLYEGILALDQIIDMLDKAA